MSHRPKPTALKLLQGNPGHRKLPAAEPTPTPGCAMPVWLKGAAREQWAELAPMLERLGVLTETDGAALAVLCLGLAKLKAEASVGAFDPRLAAEVRQWFGRFGLSPSDRVRVHVAEPKKPESKLSRFIRGATD